MLRGIYAYMGSSPSGNKIGRGSGEVITFDTNLAAPLISLTLDIEPHQAGSGDPSPTNVRPITGYTGINVYVSPTGNISDAVVYPIAFPAGAGTVYGGTLDVTNGVLTVDHIGMRLTSSNQNWTSTGSIGNGYRFYTTLTPACALSARQIMTSHWKYLSGNYGDWGTYQVYNGIFFVKNQNGAEGLTSVNAFKTWLDSNNAQICYPLATPQTYHLTPTEVRTLIGTNNIFMDADGTLTAEYQYRS